VLAAEYPIFVTASCFDILPQQNVVAKDGKANQDQEVAA
jgi:hypothetical protein